MPRPDTKDQLFKECREEHALLGNLLENLDPAGMTCPGVIGEWSVKDILLHLYEWEQMVLGWIAAGKGGITPSVPGPGFKWSQLPALNRRIFEKHSSRPLTEALDLVQSSFEQVLALVESLDEADLFTPGLYPWANRNTLAVYITGCSASHYRWARTGIRKGLKQASKT